VWRNRRDDSCVQKFSHVLNGRRYWDMDVDMKGTKREGGGVAVNEVPNCVPHMASSVL